jgi:hypothetical protein
VIKVGVGIESKVLYQFESSRSEVVNEKALGEAPYRVRGCIVLDWVWVLNKYSVAVGWGD